MQSKEIKEFKEFLLNISVVRLINDKELQSELYDIQLLLIDISKAMKSKYKPLKL